jgi:3-hydroxyisobutyrate dehydrogenase
MTRITFLGMGSMGRPMSHALTRAGHSVFGFDPSPVSRDACAKLQLKVTHSLAEALEGTEAVVSMLPTGKQVREVYAGPGGVFEIAPRAAMLIDSSTIDVATSRAMHARAAELGFDYVDAPVTGAVPAAEKAALTFMVGGTPEAVARATPTLQGMGNAVFHVGPGGSGHAMKICNNMMTGMSMAAISEVFTLGEKFGLSYQSIFDVVSRGSGSCWALTTYCPVPGPVPASPANSQYESRFSMPMMLKDMRLSQAAADELGASTPMAACAASLYELGVTNGLGKKDFSAIFELLSGRVGKTA